MTLQELLLQARPKLAGITTDDVMRDLRLLGAHALGIEASRVTLHLHDEVSKTVEDRFCSFVDQRAKSTPVSKIIQKRMFWGRDFSVDLNVLDPRGDTETLIAACLDLGPQDQVLDLGTGSGAIGLTLAAEWASAHVTCSDVSQDALNVARVNNVKLGVQDRVTLLMSDWFAEISGAYDLIVSNPPYITLDEWSALDTEVRDFDPRMALTDEGDGLSAYRIICDQAVRYLKVGGHLIVEIGHLQGRAVQGLFERAGLTEIQCLKDMAGRDRVVSGVFSTI